MLNLFKKLKSSPVVENSTPVVETIVKEEEQPNSNYPAIVHQIHKEFNSASDKALKEAQEILKSCENISMDKAERLSKLGFENTREVKELEDFKSKQKAAQKRAELIQGANIDYPLYKFITKNDVESLCTKYGLICGDLKLFKGFVPEKNLKDIENSLDVLPKFYELYSKIHYVPATRRHIVSQKEYDKLKESGKDNLYYISVKAPEFCICAPPKDMEQVRHKLKGVFLVKDDPIVLFEVIGGYLIIKLGEMRHLII